jgi:hypothetical protein
MDFSKLLSVLSNGELDNTLYFTRKLKSEYISYSPEVKDEILNQLIDNAIKYITPYANLEQIEFNPTGYREDTIEICDIDYVGNYNEIINSFDSGSIEDIESEAENFSFYCIDIMKDDMNIKLFRRVTKFKRLYSRGLLAAFQGNQLNKIEGKMLGLDGDIDLIVFENEIAVLSHISLERIFRLEEQYSVKAIEAINYIKESNKILNFDLFEEDCLNDLRIRKVLTKMLKESNELNACFDNFDNIVETINLFELDIEVQRYPIEGLIYEDKRQLMDILRLARDSYYKSLIRELPGIDNKI